jgi:hypothetical protein
MRINFLSAVMLAISAAPCVSVSADVLQHHLNGTREGSYVDPLIVDTFLVLRDHECISSSRKRRVQR